MIQVPEHVQRALEVISARWPAGGIDIEAELPFLRASGLTFLDCMTAVLVVTGCRVGEAKLLVHHSAAWADEKVERQVQTDRLIDEVHVALGDLE